MPKYFAHHHNMMRSLAETISANLKSLKEDRLIASDNALAKLAGVDQKSVWRIIKCEQSPTAEMLEKLARPFGLHAWQLMIPDLDPKNPPVFVMTDAERKLYSKLAIMASEFVAAEKTIDYDY